jgi:hypothetical protein
MFIFMCACCVLYNTSYFFWQYYAHNIVKVIYFYYAGDMF